MHPIRTPLMTEFGLPAAFESASAAPSRGELMAQAAAVAAVRRKPRLVVNSFAVILVFIVSQFRLKRTDQTRIATLHQMSIRVKPPSWFRFGPSERRP